MAVILILVSEAQFKLTAAQTFLIENNIFEHHGHIATISGFPDEITIRGNTFQHSISSTSCSLISFQGEVSFRIENNLIHGTDCTAISYSSFENPFITKAVTHIITNNTIIDAVTAISEQVVLDGNETIIQNNILIGSHIGLNIYRPIVVEALNIPNTIPQIRNNLFFNNTYDTNTIDDINITLFVNNINLVQDPLFIDPGNMSFQPDEASPAIDAGTNNSAPSIDIINTIRPQDGNNDLQFDTDIGAYEYQPL